LDLDPPLFRKKLIEWFPLDEKAGPFLSYFPYFPSFLSFLSFQMTSVLSASVASVASSVLFPELAALMDPDVLWGDIMLDLMPEGPAAPEKPWEPQPYDEEVLEDFVAPTLGALGDLENHFPVHVVRDTSPEATGLQRFKVLFYNEDDFQTYRDQNSTVNEHYQNFAYWEEHRLLHTLKNYPYKFSVSVTDEEGIVVTLVESPTPLQLVQRFPFVWDQRGPLLGIKIHRAKMADCARTLGVDYETAWNQMGLALATRMIDREDVEVQIEGILPGCIFNVRLLDYEEEVRPAPASSSSAAVVIRPPASNSSASSSLPPHAPRARALDALNRFPVAWKRDGPLHSIEVHRAKMATYASQPVNRGKTARALEAEVKDALLAALQGCTDCEVLPPPRGSAFFYVVRMLSPLRA